MIIAAIEGNIPSLKAHSVTTMKMADALMTVSNDKVTVLTSSSYASIKNRIKYWPISRHYGVNRNLHIQYLSNFRSEEFFSKSIGINGMDVKFEAYLKRNRSHIKFVYARSFLITLTCIKLEIPVVMETHSSTIENEDFKKVIKLAHLDSFKGIITIHEKLKSIYIKAGVPNKKVLVADDGFSINLFENLNSSYSTDNNNKKIVFVGGLYKEKGIDDIIDLSILCQNRNDKNIVFDLYGGSKDQVNFWKSRAEQKGSKNINFHGHIPNSQVPKKLSHADLLIMPYPKLDHFSVMDISTTSPLKLFEYMAAGKPILSSKISATSKILTHEKNCYLAEPGDIEGLYRGLSKIFEDKDLNNKISKNALKDSSYYSWENRALRLLDFFHLK